jgi:hypothetical protein
MSEYQGAIFNEGQPNEKRFPFVRVTLAKQPKIMRKLRPTLRGAFKKYFFPYNTFAREWKMVRSVAFDWKWKWIGYVPKELRCSQINLKQAGELKASFFGYFKATVDEHNAPLKPWMTSETETKIQK